MSPCGARQSMPDGVAAASAPGDRQRWRFSMHGVHTGSVSRHGDCGQRHQALHGETMDQLQRKIGSVISASLRGKRRRSVSQRCSSLCRLILSPPRSNATAATPDDQSCSTCIRVGAYAASIPPGLPLTADSISICAAEYSPYRPAQRRQYKPIHPHAGDYKRRLMRCAYFLGSATCRSYRWRCVRRPTFGVLRVEGALVPEEAATDQLGDILARATFNARALFYPRTGVVRWGYKVRRRRCSAASRLRERVEIAHRRSAHSHRGKPIAPAPAAHHA